MRFTYTRSTFIALTVCLLTVFLSSPASALTSEQSTRASSLFAAYRESMKKGDRDAAEEAIAQMIDELPAAAAAVVYKEILTEAETMARDYARDAEALLARNDDTKAVRDPEVVQDRKLIAEIYATKDEAAQKKRLAEEGWPAMQRLRAKLLPDPREKLEADVGLRLRRESILFRMDLCDDLAEHAGLPRDGNLRDRLKVSAGESARLMSIATAKDRRVLAANRKAAESGAVPELDVAGVEDANRLRMLAGLPALLLDPKLCKAALIHSEDMFKHKFFAHESPVKGRRGFTDRAREAGTTASAENIASGNENPMAANQAWFHSPGHFMNFFRPGFTRIGFGTHEKRYTQLFGG
jgi:uncharacterized protein YkwD